MVGTLNLADKESKALSNIQGVLFDVDGTLIDSNDAHAYAWVEALAEQGHQVPFEQVRRLIGMGGDKLLPTVTGLEKDSPQGKQISERRGQIFRRSYLPTLRPFPGTRQLLQRLREAGYKLAIATSAQPSELEDLLKVAKITEFFQEESSSGDTSQSKPDPDIIQIALKKTGLEPAAALMIGDTPYDIEAAEKAGVKVLAFRCGGWQDSDLSGAIAIYTDPSDLLNNIDTSPLAHSG